MLSLESISQFRDTEALLLERCPILAPSLAAFMLMFAESIQLAPLQIYSAALYFSPLSSVIRHGFWHLRPWYLRLHTQLLVGRNAYLHILEGYSGWVGSLVFSHDESRVASGWDDKTVRIWDDGEKLIYKVVENTKRLIGEYVVT